ncbi:MAG: carbohydrate ABC transporter permease [Clostridia bacterium]|nr:carbohydrate ABC transporter permease [Clostridia bacterium]
MNKRIESKRTGKIFVVILLSLGAIIMMLPFLWAISVSLQGPGLAYVTPPQFFKPPYHFDNYIKVFKEGNFLRYAANSVFVSVVCIVGQLFSNSLIGFGFAKYNFKGSQLLFFTALCTMMIPHNIMSVPQYIMWHNVGALDTYLPMTVKMFFGTAFNVFLMRQCFMGMPNAFYEAALLDGANPIKIFFRIYLPMAKPMLATMATTTFMGSWNNVFEPLIYLTSESKYTLSLGLLYIKGNYEHNIELLMAAAIIAMIPVVVIYFFAQKYFVEGLSSSAVKG